MDWWLLYRGENRLWGIVFLYLVCTNVSMFLKMFYKWTILINTQLRQWLDWISRCDVGGINVLALLYNGEVCSFVTVF